MTDALAGIDAFLVPLGNGALATGVGCWLKAASPTTKVIAVVAEGAACMALSWRQGRVVATARADTIGDGIAVRVPVPFALDCMTTTVDEVLLVSDSDLLAAMSLIDARIGRRIEPAGVAGFAGLLRHRDAFAGQRVATVLCGGNLTNEQNAMVSAYRAEQATTTGEMSAWRRPSISMPTSAKKFFGRYTLGDDAKLLKIIKSANVACGMHAGDPTVMRKTVELAKANGVSVGAHPGFNDIWGFGGARCRCAPTTSKTSSPIRSRR